MQYLGGKSRIANDISAIINTYSQDKDFISLFCGACAIESKVIAKSKTCNDKQEYLIELLKAVQNGWKIPDEVSKEEYEWVKNNKNVNKPLTGFVGFACAFGGKWFGGYAKNNSGTNYAKQSKNSLLKKMEGLYDTTFVCLDYREVKIPPNSVVYCDPPYENTTGYSNSSEFNHNDFWEYMRTISKDHIVFISELKAPEDFVVIWEKPFKRVLDVNKENIFESRERLFLHKSVADKLDINYIKEI